jgi:formylglycine-generating enzyme required for sulfatase activity
MKPHLLLVSAVLLLVAGCGGGSYAPPATGGGDGDDGGGEPPPPTDGSVLAVSLTTGLYRALPATIAPASDVLLFRRIPAGSVPIAGGDLVIESGTSSATVTATSLAASGVALYELTQGQWTALCTRAGITDAARTRPWEAVRPMALAGTTGDRRPALGLSYTLINQVLTAWNTGTNVRLRLPTANEWEGACRGGPGVSAALYSWGSSTTTTTVDDYAWVRETMGSAIGPQEVGRREDNALGLYDMHGNVWEWVTNGASVPQLRGGSWYDNLVSAQSGNRQDVDQDVPLATAGVRLALETLP